MFPQNYMNTKDGVEGLQMLNTAASHGDLGIQRSVVKLFASLLCQKVGALGMQL